ncbi:energy-coupling factor ABC transporter ATP-binding protein [Xylocopilactobacillus apis]|uniref:Energy-coupling factor transporter ATP-binding protein EcfA1 n=1 Tax=Xylocopilactobacillus apis TaxID=2932183 RepID=A0AAU9D1I2_9LACO|nr:energy-coupling factor ABC transporter ATP-binding protein [Xylocopilactobacillus apis]BDR56135.1 energy-coupling factor transporter ATP-binding protein EcfA1 [Xylocopilactobacillus apis]
MNATPLLEIRNLSYAAEQLINLQLETKKQEIINNLNFSIFEGEFVGLVGPNGSGKTTISKLLTRIIEPTGGEILLNGINYEQIEPQWKLHHEISLVFQNVDSQFIAPNFVEDLSLYLANFGWSKEKIKSRMMKIVNELGIESIIKQSFKTLSGGQKQLLAIAEALVLEPKILILDEPTAQLDPENSQLVYKLMRELQEKRKVTILLITHKLAELALTKRVLILNQGQITNKIETNDLLLNPSLLKENQMPIPITVDIINRLADLINDPISLQDSSLATFIKTVEELYVNR